MIAIDPLHQLNDAVARGIAAMLSLPSDGMFRDYRTRFIAYGEQGLWMESVPREGPLIAQLIRTCESCPVIFNLAGQALVFKSPLLALDPSHHLGNGINVEALLLQRPEAVSNCQRRANYRVAIGPDTELTLRAWRVPETADFHLAPAPHTELAFSPCDISATGVGGKLHTEPGAHPLVIYQRLRISLKWSNLPEIILDSRLVSSRSDGESKLAHVGMQFQGLQTGIDGRRNEAMLDRIMGELRRVELRKAKLSVNKT